MKKCPVFVLPSEREGYGIAVQEALLVGATVLVSNHPDNAARELIDQTNKGRIVGEQTAQAWADEISNLIATGIFANSVNKGDQLSHDNSQDNFVSDYQFSWNLTLAAR
jgi:glycosyltransferase involved in cell wall biosynthesis